MTRKLTIKREIRTLGLDLCNPRRLVGAIVRGGAYLDGVVVFPSNPIPKSRSIASAILATRFFPELRLIMMHDSKARIDPKVIEKWTKLPVIQIDSARRRNPDGFKSYHVAGKELQVKSSLQPRTLPKTKAECPKCNNHEAFYWLVQTRGGDESSTQFFRCTNCGATWRENS